MTMAKPDSPPPAYSTMPSISSSSAPSADESASTAAAPFDHQRHHHVYGPTPLLQQQGVLLPYYDPQSPYSLEQAVSRARWRFVGAMLWALGIWLAFGIVTGGIVIDIRRV